MIWTENEVQAFTTPQQIDALRMVARIDEAILCAELELEVVMYAYATRRLAISTAWWAIVCILAVAMGAVTRVVVGLSTVEAIPLFIAFLAVVCIAVAIKGRARQDDGTLENGRLAAAKALEELLNSDEAMNADLVLPESALRLVAPDGQPESLNRAEAAKSMAAKLQHGQAHDFHDALELVKQESAKSME